MTVALLLVPSLAGIFEYPLHLSVITLVITMVTITTVSSHSHYVTCVVLTTEITVLLLGGCCLTCVNTYMCMCVYKHTYCTHSTFCTCELACMWHSLCGSVPLPLCSVSTCFLPMPLGFTTSMATCGSGQRTNSMDFQGFKRATSTMTSPLLASMVDTQ